MHNADLMQPHLNNLKRELVLISPYFVPGDRGGETVRHTSEPDVGALEGIRLFFDGLAPESLI